MQLNKIYKKISLVLVLNILLGNVIAPLSLVYAQEVESTPTPEVQSSEVVATIEPTPSIEPVIVEVSPSPFPTSTPIPTPTMSPDEYDSWKLEKRKIDDEREKREDEWEANEENNEWVLAHGGNENYYVSGQWHIDQEALKATPTPQPQQEDVQPELITETQVFQSPEPETLLIEEDPFIENNRNSCSSEEQAFDSSANVDVSNDNCANIQNDSYAGGVSGDNNVSQNDSSVSLNTGNSSGNGNIQNNGNTNVVDSDSMATYSSNETESLQNSNDSEEFSNDEGSENFVEGQDTYSLSVQNNNAAYVDNQMDVEGRSGNNTLTENDGQVELTTGDIELIANMLNVLNLNITGDDFLHLIVNIFGNIDSNLDLDDIASILGYSDDEGLEVVAKTDENIDDSETSLESNVSVDNTNQAVVNNELNVNGVSGNNDVEKNDGGADVVTGRIQILANIMNFINANFSGEKWQFIMVNVFGNLTGDIILPDTQQFLGADGEGSVSASNQNAHDSSSNNQSASSFEQTNIVNENNVELNNSVNANGVTGNNNQLGNDDDSHTVNSGKTDVASQILNYLNFNITGNNWVFLVVNVFGKWMGQIVGYAGNDPINAPDNGTFTALSVGSGSSDENANYDNVESNTDVTNNNNAVVNNTINAQGVSGQNDVNQNDGSTSITTGWVEIDANLLNIINTNITGRSWMVVFLNVFGDFFGNMFFGQENADQYALANSSNQESEQQASAIGGNSEVQNNTNTSNNNSQNQNTSSSNSASVTSTQTEVTNQKTAKVLSISVDEEPGENSDEVYEAEYEYSQNEPEKNLSWSEKLLSFITQLMYNVYDLVKGLWNPFLALAKNILSPLS